MLFCVVYIKRCNFLFHQVSQCLSITLQHSYIHTNIRTHEHKNTFCWMPKFPYLKLLSVLHIHILLSTCPGQCQSFCCCLCGFVCYLFVCVWAYMCLCVCLYHACFACICVSLIVLMLRVLFHHSDTSAAHNWWSHCNVVFYYSQ